ncbi:hypothetical protein NW762_006159 [Fusarium torreyae]|uniref:Uncharacterized protein n=1 Tax=Fusarium torreyae TaxID=1237075 RepID=A0A9W8S2D3_9HYPO|nr:hypothetical protein NW762_006159 [Fusarium torreyae]
MSSISGIYTSKAPKPLPQFSQAVVCNGIVYCSGNIGWDPKTRVLVSDNAKEQAHQTLKNLEAILEEAGSSLRKVVKANIFLMKMDDFQAVNEAWDEFFTEDVIPKPCRTCVAVAQLPMGASVEIECTAVLL